MGPGQKISSIIPGTSSVLTNNSQKVVGPLETVMVCNVLG